MKSILALFLIVLCADNHVYSFMFPEYAELSLTGACRDHNTVISVEIAESPGSACRLVSTNDSEWWVCSDLQTALEAIGAVAEVGRAIFGSGSTASLINSDCFVLVIPSGLHYITAPLHFGNTSVHFTGVAESTTIYCNYTIEPDQKRIFELDYEYPDYVMYFNQSMSVTFEGIEVIGCPYPLRLDTVAVATVTNSTFKYFTEAVFDIYNSPNITITDCSFLDNRGTGISRYPYRGNGGAVAISYNSVRTQSLAPQALVLRCNFTNNSATAANQFRTTNNAFFNRIFTGRGGGLAFFFNESFHNVSVWINDNHFENNYARSFGGGVYIVFFGDNTQQRVVLERNTYISNTARLGAGALLVTFISNGIIGAPHMVNVSDSLVFNNAGQTGGAVLIYVAYEVFGVSFVKFDNCRFIQNHGLGTRDEYGAAIGIYLVNQFRNREAPQYEVIDCLFEENFGINGVLTVGYAPVLFRGNTTFIRNNGTSSLTVLGSLVEFFDNVSFINNSVGEEGALHLLSFGQFRLREGADLLFEGNKGRIGASILIDTPTATIAFDQLLFNPQCFVLYENLFASPTTWDDVSVTFRDNSAVLGSSIYASRLSSCSWFALRPPYFNKTYVRWWPLWDFGNDSVNTGYSDPFNQDYQVETVAEVLDTPHNWVTAWPGQKFTISLTGWDQFRHATAANSRFLFTANSSTLGDMASSVAVKLTPEVIIIDAGSNSTMSSTLAEYFTLSYAISVGEALNTEGPIGMVEIDAPFDSVQVRGDTFELYPSLCPAGYILVSTQRGLQCQCKENVTEVIHCEDDQDKILIQTGLWVTSVVSVAESRHVMRFYPCPPGYCRCSQNSSLGETSCAYIYQSSDPNAQCVCNREGVLCGGCRHGLGVSALLNKCVTCNNASGLLILVLIVLDVVVFVLLALADTPLPQWSYPFIFYIQIAPYVALYFPESFEYVGKALHFISSATSFYFVYDFCLYGSMSPLVSYFLRYIPLIIALLLIPLVILFRKKRWRVLKHHGMWWIVLLLYSHVVYTSMSILDCPILPPGKSPRWFVNGNIECFTGGHIPLALLAILVLAVCIAVIPLTALISIKIHRKSLKLYWLQFLVSPLKVSFKKEWRWWSAVELGRRFVFILFIISFPRNNAVPLLMMCVMLTLYGMVQPYKSKAANYFEILVQLNFILLLLFPSTRLIKESLFRFSPPNYDSMMTNKTCIDKLSSVAPITWLLFPFYYLPLLGFVAVGTAYLVVFIKKKIKAQKQSKVVRVDSIGIDDSTNVNVYYRRGNITTTDVELDQGLQKSTEF